MSFILNRELCKRLCGFLIHTCWDSCEDAMSLFYLIYNRNNGEYENEGLTGWQSNPELEVEFRQLLTSADGRLFDSSRHPAESSEIIGIWIDRVYDYAVRGYPIVDPIDDDYYSDDDYDYDDEEYDGETVGEEMLF